MTTTATIFTQAVADVLRRAATADPDLREHPPLTLEETRNGHLVDTLICTPDQNQSAEKLFSQLRWGGQLIFVTPSAKQAADFSQELAASGFEITQPPSHISRRWMGLPIPFFSKKTHYFVARKLHLVRPGTTTDRFTFHVYLGRPQGQDQYVVVKEVPSTELVMARLRSKWPDLPKETIEKRAKKFSEKIFPIFLTREAAILKIVNRDLPEQYRQRVPQLIDMEQDEKGYARRLYLSWLRNGGQPLDQLAFARQSADLLRVLHDQVQVMHLDLRLDNFVITPQGVGFVDFGSSVRVDENLKESPLLASLFDELMHTSAIQRMLLNMTRTGEVTSQAISRGLHKVDKAVDFFYLAVQINSPHANPDLKDLIQYDRQSPQAKLLSQLTEQVLRPADPARPKFRSAADILKGIQQIERHLASKSG
jgi:hypothetical protein